MFSTRRILTPLASRLSVQTCVKPAYIKPAFTVRSFTSVPRLNMPEQLKQSEVNSKTDPSVSKQLDTESSLETKTKDLYEIVDGLKIGILGTYRPGVGVSQAIPNPLIIITILTTILTTIKHPSSPTNNLSPPQQPVGRSMAVAKRTGPDFLFLANAHSQKFNDLENGPPEAAITFLNSSNQDWVSITGECVTSDNSDPRIKEIWSKGTKAWFGDLGDGVHTGGPEDPRMKLIEIKAKCEFFESLGFG